MRTGPLTYFAMGLTLAPLLPGIVNRTKAVFAGRRGAPLLQAYFDIWKLLRKGAVYSRTTTVLFRAAPVAGLSAIVLALLVVPAADGTALLPFGGDIILLAYLLGLMRFFTVVAALDTGSSFEGMGASREVLFSALAEPALLMGGAALVLATGSLSLAGIFAGLPPEVWRAAGPGLALVAVAFLIVFLVENSRIPFDDPNTHLELTMIHEVMILDYSGHDLAVVLYAASLKLWVIGVLIVDLLLAPLGFRGWAAATILLGGMFALAVLVGTIESVMARIRLLHVPGLLVGAGILSVLAFTLVTRLLP